LCRLVKQALGSTDAQTSENVTTDTTSLKPRLLWAHVGLFLLFGGIHYPYIEACLCNDWTRWATDNKALLEATLESMTSKMPSQRLNEKQLASPNNPFALAMRETTASYETLS
jgi:hypothetical protein